MSDEPPPPAKPERAIDGSAATSPTAPVPIDGRSSFRAALQQALTEVATRGSRELWLCDAHYEAWPLGDRAVVEHFGRWAYSHRRLVMLACSFDQIARQHPRWANWRRQWSHIVDCRQLPPEIETAACPTLLIAPGVCTLRLFDPLRFRGTLSWADDPATHEALETVDVLLQRSEPGFPVTTLGL